MKLIDIGEVAARSGIKPSALRYYEEIGLITSASRHGLRRQFEPAVLVQLKLVALAKASGFSLDEIIGMLGKGGGPSLPRDVLRQKAAAIDERIRQLASGRGATAENTIIRMAIGIRPTVASNPDHPSTAWKNG